MSDIQDRIRYRCKHIKEDPPGVQIGAHWVGEGPQTAPRRVCAKGRFNSPAEFLAIDPQGRCPHQLDLQECPDYERGEPVEDNQ